MISLLHSLADLPTLKPLNHGACQDSNAKQMKVMTKWVEFKFVCMLYTQIAARTIYIKFTA